MPPMEGNESETNNTQASDPLLGGAAEVDSLRNMKVPAFWRVNPKLWFLQVEAQFHSNGIKSDLSKYYAVVSALDCNTLQQVADLLESPPVADKYKTLKTALISTYADSHERQLQKLLNEAELGDQKPSHLLRHMKSLANNQIMDDALKTLWLQRLPNQVQLILSASQGVDIAKMAEIADKIVEVNNSSGASIAAVTRVQTSATPTVDVASMRENLPPPADAASSEIAQLQAQITNLTKMVEELRVNRNRHRSRERWRGRSRSRTPGPNSAKEGECFYHRRFGTKARKCTRPCTHYNPEN